MINFTRNWTEQKSVVFHAWECPRCEIELQTSGELPTEKDYWAYCEECQEMRERERFGQWVSDFTAAYRHLVGATITDVNPNKDDWYDCPDNAKEAGIESVTLRLDPSRAQDFGLPVDTVVTISSSRDLDIGYRYPSGFEQLPYNPDVR